MSWTQLLSKVGTVGAKGIGSRMTRIAVGVRKNGKSGETVQRDPEVHGNIKSGTEITSKTIQFQKGTVRRECNRKRSARGSVTL